MVIIAVVGSPPCSSFYTIVSMPLANYVQVQLHTGTGLRICSVCLMKSCGLWRMAIMRVGCIAIMRVGCIDRALVALNMFTVLGVNAIGVESWRVSWRRGSGTRVDVAFTGFVTGTQMLRELAGPWTPGKRRANCVWTMRFGSNGRTIAQPHHFTSVTTTKP